MTGPSLFKRNHIFAQTSDQVQEVVVELLLDEQHRQPVPLLHVRVRPSHYQLQLLEVGGKYQVQVPSASTMYQVQVPSTSIKNKCNAPSTDFLREKKLRNQLMYYVQTF